MSKVKRVLVAGASGQRGRKVLEFLKNRGFVVFGADRNIYGRNIEGIARFFKLNLRHRDSIWLMFEVCKPDALVYCAISKDNNDNYGTYLGILSLAMKFGVGKVVLVVNKSYSGGVVSPSSLLEVEEIAAQLATDVLSKDGAFKYRVIGNSDNLLKETKKFLAKNES